MRRTTFLATAALGTSLVLGAVGVAAFVPGVAGAQTTSTTQAPAATAEHPGHGNHPRLRAVRRHELKVAADTIGVTPAELRTDLKDGQSVADVANSKGVSPDTVVQAIVSDVTARVDKAVTNGKLTQQRADQIEARLPDRVTKLVDHHRGDRDGAHAQPQPQAQPAD